ncbi:cytochrome P450 71A1-like [Papaver somniferum]|uniref:cytochrome P450 71A1-like n=1 Tax=Papaver somniferum TaxID=3469 RepID=UPI000E6F5866|nr:cytochrome P450 71A1-like [Papaver somniferum]
MDVFSFGVVVRKWLEHQPNKGYSTSHLFTISIPTLLFSLFFLFKIHGVWSSSKKSNIHNLPPSPPRIPIVGNLHQVGTLAHRSFRDLSQKYGPLMLLHLGRSPTLVVSSAEMATEIMKNQDVSFANRPFTNAANALLYGCTDIAFAPYGEYWRQVKKISVLQLLSVKRVQSFKYVREEEVDIMIEKISSSCSLKKDGEQVINLSEALQTLTNNIVSRCVLGAKYESAHGNRFGQLSKEIMELLGAFSVGDYFPSLGWIDVVSGLSSKFNNAFQELDIFLDRVITEHLLRHSKSQNDDGQADDSNKLDLTDVLLLSQKDHSKVSRNNIKAIIMDMFVSGSHTSATAMEWTMSELIKNPKMMDKAQDEVRRVLGNKFKIEEADINQMDYLKCIVKEILRLHPPIPTLVPRESPNSTTKLAGYDIPPNTTVYINAWAIHRDSKVWENPEEFRPERFIDNPVSFKGQDFQFIPFGSGRRGCPGLSFGIAIIEFALANLLYRFNWEVPAGEKREELDMTEASGFTVNRKFPLRVVPSTIKMP